ncbi:uncharacterized protein LOC119185213 isoform X1 [Rhipicephalus microplus]|uniref:uncharacterized protein LOC119185213 isoform X1 n=1 Tax=Rhipicephalus microplus TaxID=6941 RepID=UPI003F6D4BAB
MTTRRLSFPTGLFFLFLLTFVFRQDWPVGAIALRDRRYLDLSSNYRHSGRRCSAHTREFTTRYCAVMRIRKVPKAEVEKPATDSKEEEETNGEAVPPAKKAKAEPARTRPQRENKSAGGRRVSSLEAAAKEGEALLKELGHKDSSDPDSGRRRTRSQTRGTPPAPPARQQRQTRAERKTPAKPARGAKKAAASKRSKKEESEEEEEEAASAEEASTTAANEDESTDDKDKNDEKDEVNNDDGGGEARQVASEDANTDHNEPEVNNKEEKATTDGGSKASATTTADSKADAEPPVAKENALAGDSVSAPVATKPPEEVAA